MPVAIKMPARTSKYDTSVVELSERHTRWLAKHAALQTFNSIWREEMAQLTALRAASDTLREEIATASTPTVVTCAKCKQVVTGCPRVHFREKHAAP